MYVTGSFLKSQHGSMSTRFPFKASDHSEFSLAHRVILFGLTFIQHRMPGNQIGVMKLAYLSLGRKVGNPIELHQSPQMAESRQR